MDTYLVIFEQAGEGCDYTIGCGTLVIEVKALSMMTAMIAAFDKWGWRPDYDNWDGEQAMESVKIYKVSEMNETLFEEHRTRVQDIQRKSKETDDLAMKRKLFEDLKKELGEA